MKIYYENTTGKIIAANYDRDDFTWANSINVAYSVLSIDEIDPENKGLCLGIVRSQGKIDSAGDPKYYIVNGELYDKDGWIEEPVI